MKNLNAYIPLNFEYKGWKFLGEGRPVNGSCFNGACSEVSIMLNNYDMGLLRVEGEDWKLDHAEDPGLARRIGEIVRAWFE